MAYMPRDLPPRPWPPPIRATSCLPRITLLRAVASGPLVLKSLLEDLPEPRAYGVVEPHTQQGKIAGGVDLLGVDPHLEPRTPSRRVGPGGGRQTSSPGKPGLRTACRLGAGGLQLAMPLLQGPPVLHRQEDQGDGLALVSGGRSPQRHVNTPRISHVMANHTMKRPHTTVMRRNIPGGRAYGSRPARFGPPPHSLRWRVDQRRDQCRNRTHTTGRKGVGEKTPMAPITRLRAADDALGFRSLDGLECRRPDATVTSRGAVADPTQ
jgi:hypothetical protein